MTKLIAAFIASPSDKAKARIEAHIVKHPMSAVYLTVEQHNMLASHVAANA
tara:strand:+ start:1841 stop:1993 length:153 start_codon:yes stop_codon:yes gene_type:complete